MSIEGDVVKKEECRLVSELPNIVKSNTFVYDSGLEGKYKVQIEIRVDDCVDLRVFSIISRQQYSKFRMSDRGYIYDVLDSAFSKQKGRRIDEWYEGDEFEQCLDIRISEPHPKGRKNFVFNLDLQENELSGDFIGDVVIKGEEDEQEESQKKKDEEEKEKKKSFPEKWKKKGEKEEEEKKEEIVTKQEKEDKPSLSERAMRRRNIRRGIKVDSKGRKKKVIKM